LLFGMPFPLHRLVLSPGPDSSSPWINSRGQRQNRHSEGHAHFWFRHQYQSAKQYNHASEPTAEPIKHMPEPLDRRSCLGFMPQLIPHGP
jgi:hypothetical protein